MERGYQRSRIQEESMYYEIKKADGSLPLIGVNTFLNPDKDQEREVSCMELSRATEEEKASQLRRLRESSRPVTRTSPRPALSRLKKTALSGGNIFAELMETVKTCSLGQITQALYEVGGRYRRNM